LNIESLRLLQNGEKKDLGLEMLHLLLYMENNEHMIMFAKINPAVRGWV